MDKKLATLSLSSTTEAGRNSPSVDTESEKANRRLQVPDRLKFQVDGVEGTVVGEVKLAPSPSPSPPVEDKFDVLVRWLAENGTKFPDLYLKSMHLQSAACMRIGILVRISLSCRFLLLLNNRQDGT